MKQAPCGSAISRALDPTREHTAELEMLRGIEYSTRWLRWANTEDGAKGRNRPEPLRFPWEPKPKPAFDADVMTIDEIAARLGWPAPKVVSNGSERL